MAQPNMAAVAQAFTTISEASGTLAQEMPQISNIPALQGGPAILDALHGIGAQMNALNAQLNAQMNALNAQLNAQMNALIGRMDKMENRMANSELRIINAKRFTANGSSQLHPLRNITTGGAIPGFPTKMAELFNLDDAAITGILGALDIILVPETPLDEKIEIIREKWV